MKKRVFLLNALLLTGTSIVTRFLAMGMNVFMSNRIGSMGIGLFQLISTVYLFSSNFFTSGIHIAVTRLVSQSLAQHRSDLARAYLHKCLVLSLFISAVVASILFVFSEKVASLIIHDMRAALSLRILSLSLPFMAVSSCLRGFFYAVRNAMKPAAEQLLEQLIEFSTFALILSSFSPQSIEMACASVVVGTTVGEIVSFFFSLLCFLPDRKRYPSSANSYHGLFRPILDISLPITAGCCLRSGLKTIENVLVPLGLKKSGVASSSSLATYGLVMGMVFPVLSFPSVLLLSFSTLLITEVSEAYAVNHRRNIQYIAERMFQVTCLFACFVTGFLFFFPLDISRSVYSCPDAAVYIRIFAPLVPLMYLDMVVDAMLKGLSQQLYYMSYNFIDSLLRVALIIVLLPMFAVRGWIAVFFVSTILNASLSIARLLKVTGLKLDLFDWLVKPVVSILFACFLVKRFFLEMPCNTLPVKTMMEGGLALLFYLVFLFVSKAITRQDVTWFGQCLSFRP